MTAFQWLTSYLRLTGAKSSGRNWQCPSHEDSYPSLSISATELGHALLHCHGGCTWERVMDSLGLHPSLLFEPHSLKPEEVFCQNLIKPSFPKLTRGNHFRTSDRRVDFHIVYHEYTTEVRLSRIRYSTGEKRCLWQIKEGGHWRNSREGDLDLSMLPLYNETEVIRGGFLNEVIVVCESESSVDALTERGIYATTWAGGASAVKTKRLVEVLQDRRVLWVPDNDSAGYKCSQIMEDALKPEVSSWNVLVGNEGEDARDLLNRDVLNLQYLGSL